MDLYSYKPILTIAPGIHLFKFKNGNIRTIGEFCSKFEQLNAGNNIKVNSVFPANFPRNLNLFFGSSRWNTFERKKKELSLNGCMKKFTSSSNYKLHQKYLITIN